MLCSAVFLLVRSYESEVLRKFGSFFPRMRKKLKSLPSQAPISKYLGTQKAKQY